MIEIIKGAGGEDDIGDAVIDDFTHFDDMAACTVLPPEADPSVTTTTTSTTTTHHREGSDQIVTQQCVRSVKSRQDFYINRFFAKDIGKMVLWQLFHEFLIWNI